jgi:hypothetical protein
VAAERILDSVQFAFEGGRVWPRHHDDEMIDDVHISLIPWLSVGDESGNEWRVSALIEFKYKGKLVHECVFPTLEMACNVLPCMFLQTKETGQLRPDHTLCAQPGCSNPVTIVYRARKKACHHCGNVEEDSHVSLIGFCKTHQNRGTADVEDNDSNYSFADGEYREKED